MLWSRMKKVLIPSLVPKEFKMKRIFLLAAAGIVLFALSCSNDKSTNGPPIVDYPIVGTEYIDNVSMDGALIGSYVLYEGSGVITQRGVCWSSMPTPTTIDSSATVGSGMSTYNIPITGLLPHSTYFVRSYVVLNAVETIYGPQTSFTTRGDALPGMVLMQGGTFQMGRTKGEGEPTELPVHTVTVSDFYIGRFEVTQMEWGEVMDDFPAIFHDPLKPVENVSWLDCIVYCNMRSIHENLSPAYTYADLGTDPDNWGWETWTPQAANDISCNFTVNGYRLPTEAEWEFAAKAGVHCVVDCLYCGCDFFKAVGWYRENSASPQFPGLKGPNRAFLYDMSGNVWEWCWDRYGVYSASAATNPTGASSGTYRVRRGGSWYSQVARGRSSQRVGSVPELKTSFIGLRVVRSAG